MTISCSLTGAQVPAKVIAINFDQCSHPLSLQTASSSNFQSKEDGGG
jgi:hypothetical protein